MEEGLEHMDFTLRTGTESRTVTAAGNISTAADAGAAANAGAAQSLAGKLSRKICPSCGLLFPVIKQPARCAEAVWKTANRMKEGENI